MYHLFVGGPAKNHQVSYVLRIAIHQNDICCLCCHISPGPYSYSYIGLSKGGRIVDTVACHGYKVPFLLQLLNDVDLLVGQHLAVIAIEVQFFTDRLGRLFIVACCHEELHSFRSERFDGLSTFLPYFIRQSYKPNQFVFPDHEYDRFSSVRASLFRNINILFS